MYVVFLSYACGILIHCIAPFQRIGFVPPSVPAMYDTCYDSHQDVLRGLVTRLDSRCHPAYIRKGWSKHSPVLVVLTAVQRTSPLRLNLIFCTLVSRQLPTPCGRSWVNWSDGSKHIPNRYRRCWENVIQHTLLHGDDSLLIA
jgi:hypothetical protein